MNKILEENLKPRTILVYLLFGVASYLMLKQVPIPDFLRDLIMMMQGFWAGNKVAQLTRKDGAQ
jgi:hypothetical protein